jgi:capsular polysaccharide transport system permease protein
MGINGNAIEGAAVRQVDAWRARPDNSCQILWATLKIGNSMTELSDRGRRLSTAVTAPVWTGAKPAATRWMKRLFGAVNIWLWVFVFLPTLIAGIYYFGIASDQYMSETRFIVRSQAHVDTGGGLGSLLQGVGLSRSQDDTFSVHDFIMSRDAVRSLEKNNDLRDVFDRPGADFVTRFPGLFSGDSFEAMFKHYSHFVDVAYDSSTGVSTLQVRAYRPEDAQNISLALMAYSEQLVNKLNERAENDSLQTARHEVALAEQREADIQNQLTGYRLREQMMDPKTTSTGIYDVLKQITAARVTAATELADLLKDSPSSPQIPMLKTRVATLDKQIEEERTKISGQGNSVVSKLSEYERLSLQRELAEKSLASAEMSLQTARIEAQNQQLYIEHIVQPNLADYPLYPKRIVSFLTVLATCIIAYGIAWLLIAGVREHASA